MVKMAVHDQVAVGSWVQSAWSFARFSYNIDCRVKVFENIVQNVSFLWTFLFACQAAFGNAKAKFKYGRQFPSAVGGYCLTLLHAALPLIRPSFVDGARIIHGVLPVNENVQPVLFRSVVNTIL